MIEQLTVTKHNAVDVINALEKEKVIFVFKTYVGCEPTARLNFIYDGREWMQTYYITDIVSNLQSALDYIRPRVPELYEKLTRAITFSC